MPLKVKTSLLFKPSISYQVRRDNLFTQLPVFLVVFSLKAFGDEDHCQIFEIRMHYA